MIDSQNIRRFAWVAASGALSFAGLVACGMSVPAHASEGGTIDRKVAAQPNGEVVISNIAGTIEVHGWDRDEVQVTGTLDDGVERLDLESSGGRTLVKVVLPRGMHRSSDADIEVMVPRGSSVDVSATSADVSSRGVLGTQRLNSVSGEVTADIAGDNSEVRSISGDITVRGSGKPISLRVSSVSGSVDLTKSAGKLDVVTVSGDARIQMDEVSDVRGRTTSGSFELSAKLARDGRVEVEGVSGDITLRLSPRGSFAAEIESFSGDIDGCLADGVERVSKYGPGTRLNIRTVESGARVRAKTLSGDINICD